MFGIFAKGKAARLGLQIKNWLARSHSTEQVKINLPVPKIDNDVDTARRSYRVKQVPHKNDKRMPIGTRMFRCGQGYFMRKSGYAAWSGPCPTPAAAQRTALKNMEKI